MRRLKIKVWVESDGVKDSGTNREPSPLRVWSATGPVPTMDPGVADGPASVVVVEASSVVVEASPVVVTSASALVVAIEVSSVVTVERSPVEVVSARAVEDVKVSINLELVVLVVDTRDSVKETSTDSVDVARSDVDDSTLEVTSDPAVVVPEQISVSTQ